MLVKTFGCAIIGINAIIVTIEVNSEKGIQFFLVGLPDSSVKESYQRIVASFSNSLSVMTALATFFTPNSSPTNLARI